MPAHSIGGFGPGAWRAMAGAAVAVTGCAVQAEGHVRTETAIHVETRSARPPDPEPAAATTLHARDVRSVEGASLVEVSCATATAEECNGIDGDCDGEIDEGCGYGSGAIQVTLTWHTGADLDLYVTDPTGDMLSFQTRRVPSGGRVELDGRGDCEGPDSRVEHAFWDTPTPPSGTYRVDVHYYGECGSNAGSTTATLSIAVGGKVIGAYRYGLSPTERATLATFAIP